MKKIYLGNSKLQSHYKMFRVKYGRGQMQEVKDGVMLLMNGYLQKNDGKLINVVNLQNCCQLLVYFVTGSDVVHPDWDLYIRNNLLAKYNVITGSIELGPRPG